MNCLQYYQEYNKKVVDYLMTRNFCYVQTDMSGGKSFSLVVIYQKLFQKNLQKVDEIAVNAEQRDTLVLSFED